MNRVKTFITLDYPSTEFEGWKGSRGFIYFSMIGVYKITCLKNKRVYIGQSLDVEKRLNDYKNLKNCKLQPKLYYSLNKYGVDKHRFEILTECDEMELNKWERYYQDLYHAVGKNGLNCMLTGYNGKSGRASDETKAKMSLVRKGRNAGLPMPLYCREKNYKAVINLETGIFYINATEAVASTNIKYSTLIGKLNGHAKNNTAFAYAFETNDKQGLRDAGAFNKMLSRNRILLDTANGVYYYSTKEAADAINMPLSTLTKILEGRKYNTTNIIIAPSNEPNRYTKDKHQVKDRRELEYVAWKFKISKAAVIEAITTLNTNDRKCIYEYLSHRKAA